MNFIKTIDGFIKKYMPWIILSVLLLGFWVGQHLTKAEIHLLKASILPSVILMIYAMLITMRMDELKNAFIYPKGMIYGSVLSLAVAPLLMIPIAMVFAKNPHIYTGLMLASIVPPGGMITYWTGILGANIGLATAIQTVTLLVSIIWVPYGMKLTVGNMVHVSTSVLLIKIIIMVVIPLILAYITQKLITRKYTWEGIIKIMPLSHLISSLMALYMVFIAMSVQAHLIYKDPALILLPAVGMLIYYSLAYPFSYYFSIWILREPHEKAIPIAYGFSTKNLSIAMGLAIAAFGPMALLGVVPCMLFQMPFASIWYKIFERMGKKGQEPEIALSEITEK